MNETLHVNGIYRIKSFIFTEGDFETKMTRKLAFSVGALSNHPALVVGVENPRNGMAGYDMVRIMLISNSDCVYNKTITGINGVSYKVQTNIYNIPAERLGSYITDAKINDVVDLLLSSYAISMYSYFGDERFLPPNINIPEDYLRYVSATKGIDIYKELIVNPKMTVMSDNTTIKLDIKYPTPPSKNTAPIISDIKKFSYFKPKMWRIEHLAAVYKKRIEVIDRIAMNKNEQNCSPIIKIPVSEIDKEFENGELTHRFCPKYKIVLKGNSNNMQINICDIVTYYLKGMVIDDVAAISFIKAATAANLFEKYYNECHHTPIGFHHIFKRFTMILLDHYGEEPESDYYEFNLNSGTVKIIHQTGRIDDIIDNVPSEEVGIVSDNDDDDVNIPMNTDQIKDKLNTIIDLESTSSDDDDSIMPSRPLDSRDIVGRASLAKFNYIQSHYSGIDPSNLIDTSDIKKQLAQYTEVDKNGCLIIPRSFMRKFMRLTISEIENTLKDNKVKKYRTICGKTVINAIREIKEEERKNSNPQ